MEITFLGTGSGVPSKNRNVSSLALKMLQERDEVWLFDCGEATQHQIMNTTIKPRKITKIFITHMHGDHVLGLPGFLSSRSFQSGESTVELYGPTGLKEFVETTLKTTGTHLNYPLVYKPIKEGIIYQDQDIKVSAKKLKHGIPSYAYKIEEEDKIGPLLPDRLKELGVSPGPIYETIKNQSTTVLPNGTEVHRENVTGSDIPGKRIAICGDTKPVDSLAQWVNGVDVLIHEATFIEADDQLAKDYSHSTAADAARLAKQAQVRYLLLNHISSRYQQNILEEEKTRLQSIFSPLQFVDDFTEFTVK
ncbi:MULTISPECIES: ribonuclease Z [Allobacillus]|uniref:Ribonuclease Z n=1 Tax=Allobacillus salarius TaxID=1955272 RepID=A0A556PTB5_9BACI|nr:ribonuclease Z [Allobacillus salarius]TSJ67631.1 ribonuclease Z [Allobacillus salarius]